MEIFKEGEVAWFNGFGANDNPYPAGSQEAQKWIEGYQYAAALAEQDEDY